MLYLIYFLIAMAFVHFLYEGIIAPSLRFRLRFSLFALRDRLSKVKADDDISAEAYYVLENAINSNIRFLHQCDLATSLHAHREVQRNPSLLKMREKRQHALESLSGTAKALQRDHVKLFALGLLINNGIIGLYLLPLVIGFIFCVLVGAVTGKLILSPDGLSLYS